MNTAELKVLRNTIRQVARHNANAWWELKRQIWEGGYQPYYPIQGDFRTLAESAFSRLPIASLDTLRTILAERSEGKPALSDQELANKYVPLILEEIVRRARIAAYRTVHW